MRLGDGGCDGDFDIRNIGARVWRSYLRMKCRASGPDGHSIAVVGNQAFTLVRFRGPLIRALIARGHSVFAFMPEATAEDREAMRALGAKPVAFRIDRTGINPLRDMVTVLSLFRAFRRCRVDLVLCYCIKPVIYGLWAARLAGMPRRFALIEGAGAALTDEQGASFRVPDRGSVNPSLSGDG